MPTRFVMIASALFMGALGFTLTFMPQEVLTWLGTRPDNAMTLIVKLTGALYLSFAMMNWTAKESIIGGIYNRPVAIGNFLHFLMGALGLLKALMAYSLARPVLPLVIIYAIFAILFARIFFTSPVRPATDAP